MVRAEGSGISVFGFETCPRKLPHLVSQGDIAVSCKPMLRGQGGQSEGLKRGEAQLHGYTYMLTNKKYHKSFGFSRPMANFILLPLSLAWDLYHLHFMLYTWAGTSSNNSYHIPPAPALFVRTFKNDFYQSKPSIL